MAPTPCSSEPTLALYIGEIAHGRQDALSLLYESTVSQVGEIARRVLRCRQDCEEIVCDVYMYVWRNAQCYDARRGTVMAWLAAITRNRAIDLIRKRRTTVALDEADGYLANLTTSQTDNPEHLLAQLQERHDLHRLLQRLSPVKRRLIGLAYFHDLGHDEIAATTLLPLGTVKSHVRRALQSMRSMAVASSSLRPETISSSACRHILERPLPY